MLVLEKDAGYPRQRPVIMYARGYTRAWKGEKKVFEGANFALAEYPLEEG